MADSGVSLTSVRQTSASQNDHDLLQSETRFRALFETMSEGFAVHEIICDDDGAPIDYRFLDVNPAFEQLTGLKRDETIGRTVRELIPGIEEEWIKRFGNVALTGEPTELGNYVRQLDRYFHARAYSPDHGKFAVVFEDVTAQRRAQMELEHRESQLRTLFDSSHAGIILVDTSGTITVANQRMAEMFNCPLQELVGSSYPEHVHPDQRGSGDEKMRQLIRGEIKFVGTERHYIRKDGSDFWGFLSGRRHEDADGSLISLVGHITDITDLKKAQQKLTERERYLQTIIDVSPECIKLLAPDGSLIMMNSSGLKMIEADSLEQVQGEFMYSLVVERDRSAFRELTDRVFKGESGMLEFEAVGLHGTPIWLETHAVPYRDDAGEIVALLGVTRDVTLRKHTEAELQSANDRLEAMVNALPDLLFMVDREGVIHEFRSSAPELLYLPPDQFLGKKVQDVIPEEASRTIMSAIDKAAATGCHRGATYSLPMPQGEIWYELSIAAMGDPHRPDARFIMLVRDITDRKRIETELKTSEDNYRTISRLTSDFIHKCVRTGDAPFRIIWIGGATSSISGYTPDEILDKGCWLPLVHPEDRQAVADHLMSLQPGDQKVIEFRMMSKQGETRWILETANCLAGEHEGELLLFGASTDITERKKAEEERRYLEQQLLHAQKLESLGVLAGGIAHDFNNILTAIIGNADLAMMRLNPESPARENLQRIEQAASRAADLAKQMLAYSGKGRFVVEPIDLNRLVEEMGHMLEVSISKKALLRFNLNRPLPAVDADATQLRQIIMNLVINASEAIGDKSGVISISTGCIDCSEAYLKDAWITDHVHEGLYAFIEVSDTGCGMDHETQSRIFDPFFTTKFTGRGLGMAAVLGIIRGHKGAIKVYSEPGKGSSFKVLIPAGSHPAEEFNCAPCANAWKGSGVALLVDDEETVLAIGAEMLRELGFETVTAGDGRKALEVFRSRGDIDVVILDLTMPHMDGEQCFRELRLLDSGVRVIMSSGYNEQEVIQKFAGKGLSGFVQKPYKLSTLKEALEKIFP